MTNEPIPDVSEPTDLLLSDLIVISASQAQRRRRSLLKRVRAGEGFAITRRGEIDLVMLPRQRVDQIERTILELKREIHAFDDSAKMRDAAPTVTKEEGEQP